MEVSTKKRYIDQPVKFIDIGLAVSNPLTGNLVVEQLTLTDDDFMTENQGTIRFRFANPPSTVFFSSAHIAWYRETPGVRQIEAPPETKATPAENTQAPPSSQG